MSTIHLVRHGQASFGRSNYDELSALGEEQSRLAGQTLMERGVNPDLLVSGTLQRQQVTGSRMWEAAGWEAVVESDQGWNEFDHDAIIAAHKPAFRNKAVLRAEMARHRHPRKWFQEMFVEATLRWCQGEHDEDYPETFAQFCDRITLALGRVTTRLESGQSAVVITSSGPMSWVTASLLTARVRPTPGQTSLPHEMRDGALATWVNLNQVTVNTGMTTVLAGRSLTALTINEHPHLLATPELVTYR